MEGGRCEDSTIQIWLGQSCIDERILVVIRPGHWSVPPASIYQ